MNALKESLPFNMMRWRRLLKKLPERLQSDIMNLVTLYPGEPECNSPCAWPTKNLRTLLPHGCSAVPCPPSVFHLSS